MTIYIVASYLKEKAKTAAELVAKTLIENGATCLIDENLTGFSLQNCENILQKDAFKKADIVLTIGGDGTLLHTAAQLINDPLPLLGINVGRLGFLTELETNEIEKLKLLCTGDYSIIKRKTINAQVGKKTFYALNEVVLCSTNVMRAIRYNVKCDDMEINSYRGNGVIVATPTGSTAYSLSAGGPIVDAELDCLIVTPVCAHSLNTPPLVFSENRKLKLQASECGDVQVELVVDGVSQIEIKSKEIINVTLSQKYIPFIRFGAGQQFKAIDQKLKRR
ncbi:MAG: NAD(+)/NADH kinase [Oscillospiraceae bacterium]